jgi:hypothetical protein
MTSCSSFALICAVLALCNAWSGHATSFSGEERTPGMRQRGKSTIWRGEIHQARLRLFAWSVHVTEMTWVSQPHPVDVPSLERQVCGYLLHGGGYNFVSPALRWLSCAVEVKQTCL